MLLLSEASCERVPNTLLSYPAPSTHAVKPGATLVYSRRQANRVDAVEGEVARRLAWLIVPDYFSTNPERWSPRKDVVIREVMKSRPQLLRTKMVHSEAQYYSKEDRFPHFDFKSSDVEFTGNTENAKSLELRGYEVRVPVRVETTWTCNVSGAYTFVTGKSGRDTARSLSLQESALREDERSHLISGDLAEGLVIDRVRLALGDPDSNRDEATAEGQETTMEYELIAGILRIYARQGRVVRWTESRTTR